MEASLTGSFFAEATHQNLGRKPWITRPGAHLYDDDSGIIQPHEWLEEYEPGGMHPVTLGDTFCDARYRIQDKLGYGGHSTVWLARDLQEEEWVAMKIKRADASTDELDKDAEIRTMKALEKFYVEGSQEKPRTFIRLFYCFHHEGPNGIHNCLVMELLGPSISAVIQVNRDMEAFLAPDTILRTSRQLLEAIEFAHQAGFVHGDISHHNVTFTCNQALADDDALVETLGSQPITATYMGELPRPSYLPQQIIFILFYQISPFFHDSYHPFNCYIRSMVEKLGPLPPVWNAQWNEMKAKDKKLEVKNDSYYQERLITDKFEPRRKVIIQECEEKYMVYRRDEFTDDDYEELKCLLRPIMELLQYEPNKRASLREALSYIERVDHRAEMEEEEMEEGDTDTEEADIEEADAEEAEMEGAKVEKAETEKVEDEKASNLGE
ncbi:hypothetical protein V491_06115 [Pseudogymnoascus sp. VKM F-3775]|nr:hypothetical protein V491_06115 [Pseudogymnoascus sp. VKM F-3775]